MTFRNNVLREITVYCGYKETHPCGGYCMAKPRSALRRTGLFEGYGLVVVAHHVDVDCFSLIIYFVNDAIFVIDAT